MSIKVHEFAFEVKMFAVVKVAAFDRQSAEIALDQFVQTVEPKFNLAALSSQSSIVGASLYLDDEQYPFMTAIDGDEFD
jgi:selenocysteine lyase/cysteine desulfurase